MAETRYRVVLAGVQQLDGHEWVYPEVGDEIVVSDLAAMFLLGSGHITPIDGEVPPVTPAVLDELTDLADADAQAHALDIRRCPEHPRYRGKGEPREDCSRCQQLFEAEQAKEPTA